MRTHSTTTWALALTLTASALLLIPSARAADPPARQAELEANLRKLEKDIAAVRGLDFKKPVVARIISRPGDGEPGVQGYYSIKDKSLFIYDDVSGAYERGVLIHEMVHALQDQHFGLAQLHQKSFGSDAELALAALIEGDATYTMIEVLKKDQPRVAAMLDSPLEKAGNVQNAFLYAQGARYVKALKERGGWQAVNAAYRHPPEATAEVLHPEGVALVDLGPGETRGEFGLIHMLAGNAATAPEAVRAAAGWRGDRVVQDGSARAWIIAFATDADARRCQEALARLRAAQDPELKSFAAEPGASAWHGPKGAVVAVLARGERVLVLDAPDEAGYRALRERVEGPPELLIYSTHDKRPITFGELIDRLLKVDLVCIGESHDSELNHRVQLQVIKSLFARDERLGVGMEMFQRPSQPVLDRYVQGTCPEEEFLRTTEYRQRWGFDWSLYRPIVEFCRKNGIPLAGLNAPRELTRRISKVGVGGLNDEEKKQLGAIDFHVKEHRDYWYDRLAQMHGKAEVTPEQKEHSYEVMTTWDGYMATSAAQFQQGRGLRRLVVLAGSGHIDRGFGIPARAVKQTGGSTATLHIEVGGDLEKASADPVADFLVIVK